MRFPPLPRISDHGSEIVLFGLIAGGIIGLIGFAIARGQITALDVAACLLVLQGIISAVKERWTQRSVDRMGQQLGNSLPPTDQATGKPDDPVHTIEEQK